MGFYALLLSLFITTSFSVSSATERFCSNKGNADHCMVCACYFEAGSEVFEGKVQVVQTVLTRMVSPPDFPSNACGVVYQQWRGRAQFNWVDDSKSNNMTSAAMISECERAVAEAKKRGPNGITAFQSSNEKWTWVKYCHTIGDHKFYTKKNGQCPSRSTASASGPATTGKAPAKSPVKASTKAAPKKPSAK